MASKGENTRRRIVRESAALFNVRGYAGTAMSDIIEASRIKKGGIYRHFDSKEAIATAALDYALQTRIEAVSAAIEAQTTALEQLNAIGDTFLQLLGDSPLPGGCPIMNTAIEADDVDLPLKAQAQMALDNLRGLIGEVVMAGKARGELQPHCDGDVVATLLIATCEGALMMSKLYGDSLYIQRALDHLKAYFSTLARENR